MRKLRFLLIGGILQIIIGSAIIALVGGMTSKLLGKSESEDADIDTVNN